VSTLRLINPEIEFLRYRRRMEIAGIIAALLFLGLLGRFVWLQLVQFDHYHALAENNRISLVPAPPSRGVIYDRQNMVLAHNYSAYTLEITPSKAGKLEETIDRLAEIVVIRPATANASGSCWRRARTSRASPSATCSPRKRRPASR
jgi:penicillin-binding protein 2